MTQFTVKIQNEMYILENVKHRMVARYPDLATTRQSQDNIIVKNFN